MTAAAPRNSEELEDVLSTPTAGLIEMMRRVSGDFLFLGVGGKMGPTMARMARRATDLAGVPRRILGVSRFSATDLPSRLKQWGIEPLSCDLLDENAVEKLPDIPNVFNLSGFKFGAQANPSMTWAMNCYVPAVVARKYSRSRIVAFSSGNIYARVPVTSAGSIETDVLQPIGEYAITVLGRERMYEHFSRTLSIPMALLRLNYATELRYGVLVDLARKVWDGEVIDLTMGSVNVIWQGEANAMSLQMLEHVETPPNVMNIAGAEILRVRDVATELGRLLGHSPKFSGAEGSDALLNNAARSHALFGAPQITAHQMIHWTAEWIRQGGGSLNKPTHFESRDGKY